jgi:hypothetical protein
LSHEHAFASNRQEQRLLRHRFEMAPWIAMALMLAAVSVTTQSSAQSWAFGPEFESRVGYVSNIDLDERDGEDAMRVTGAVGAVAERRTDVQVIRLRGQAGYSSYLGSDDDLGSETFQQVQGRSQFVRENTTWQLDGRAYRDRNTERNEQTIDLTDPDDSLDAGSDIDTRISRETITRYRLFLTPSVSHDLSDRLSVGAGYIGRYLGFEGSPPGYVDSWNHEVEVRTDYALTQRDTAGVSIIGGQFRPKTGGNDQDLYGVSLNYRRFLTERSGLIASAGVRRLEPAGSADDLDSSTGGVGSLQLNTRGEDWVGAITAERRLLPTLSGVLNETDQILLSATHDLGPRWQASILGRGFTTRAVGRPTPVDTTRRFVSVAPGVRYRLTPEWKLTVDYEFRHRDREGIPGTANSNLVYLGIQYTPLLGP